MKRLLVSLFVILAGTAAFAQQSEAQAQWVPAHEFHVDLFGGMSNLGYKIDNNFVANTRFSFTDALAGGAGFGYTYHFSDLLGLTTGLEVAIYRGGFTASDRAFSLADVRTDLGAFNAISWSKIDSYQNPFDNKWYVTYNSINFTEKQTLYTAQIPVMLQFMVPLNAQKSHHFYAAVGAKIGFNFLGSFNRSPLTAPKGTNPMNSGHTDSYGTFWGKEAYEDAADVQVYNTDFFPDRQFWYDENGVEFDKAQAGRNVYANAVTGAGFNENWTVSEFGAKGKMSLNLLQVLASAEVGFRWSLSKGFGLYTGLYFDYGFLPFAKGGNRVYSYKGEAPTAPGVMEYHHTATIHQGSLLECNYDDPGVTYDFARGGGNYYAWSPNDAKTNQPIASVLGAVGCGLKLKLAFGSVSQKKAEPVIQYVERIVRDTVKVVQRDTVVNTVIQKDTVVNTVIQHDTVTVVKEVPVEIQKVMADMSNSLFDTGKAIIKDDAKGPLYTVVMWLKANPDAKIEVSGHTDNVGGAAYNQKLSEARAKAVYEYFVSKGVNADRLSYAGYGMTRPIATNDTPEGREKNRRVELNVIE
ncbi:MAG: OmpA family protein [Bacteroidales bacterium]|nr:OmpA family protein [Bacteroidales bacterium]